jgi:hypothetical protein
MTALLLALASFAAFTAAGVWATRVFGATRRASEAHAPASTGEPEDPWIASGGAPTAGSADLLGDLLTARADVRGEVVVLDQLAGLLVVICLVQADALRLLYGRLGTLDRDRVERALQQLVIVAVRTVVIEPARDPRGLAENRTLRPPLALSVGFGPVFGPPSGTLVIAPSAASHAQSMPTTSSYSNKP